MKRGFALLIAMVLLVTACGDDDSTGGNEALVADLTQRIMEQQDAVEPSGGASEAPFQSEEQVACFAGALVDEFGAERMATAVTMEFEEFMTGATREERLAVIDSMFTCVDFAEVLAAEFGGAVSAEASSCLADAFVASEAFRNAMADSFVDPTTDPFDDPEMMTEMLPAMLECLSAEELIELGENG